MFDPISVAVWFTLVPSVLILIGMLGTYLILEKRRKWARRIVVIVSLPFLLVTLIDVGALVAATAFHVDFYGKRGPV